MHPPLRAIAAIAIGTVVLGQAAEPAPLADRVRILTRDSTWTEAGRIAMTFPTFHPQGMVKVGDTLFVSSVEIRVPAQRYAAPRGGYDRDAGEGAGHLFKIDLRPGRAGTLLGSARLGDGTMYHPGGIDFDGTWIWVPVAEYRPDSRSVVYRIDPETLAATEVLRVADHIGGVVRDTEARALHGVSWGSRRFFRWPLKPDATIDPASARVPSVRANPSHYVDYQDCHYAGRSTMLCGGVSELRPGPGLPIRLGGLDLIDLVDGRPLHQVPVPLWTSSGVPMTRNPVWLEPADGGLRAYFMPEDDRSVLYVYDVAKNSGAAR